MEKFDFVYKSSKICFHEKEKKVIFMENSIKKRIATGALVATMAVSMVFGNATTAYAASNTQYKQGTFVTITNELTEKDYTVYIVKEGDYTSKISEKICRHFGVEISTKYWPVVAFMNGFPRVLQPGDIIFFPDTIEEMDKKLAEYKKSGKFARYVQKYNIYRDDDYDVIKDAWTIGQLLDDIYHNNWKTNADIDPDFLKLYLKEVGLSGDYSLDTKIDNLDLYVALTIYVPTLEQIGYTEPEQVRSK